MLLGVSLRNPTTPLFTTSLRYCSSTGTTTSNSGTLPTTTTDPTAPPSSAVEGGEASTTTPDTPAPLPPRAAHSITRAAAARVVPDLRDERLGGRFSVGGETGSYVLNRTDNGEGAVHVGTNPDLKNSSSTSSSGSSSKSTDNNEKDEDEQEDRSSSGPTGSERMAASVLSPVKPGLLSDDYELFHLVEKKATEASDAHLHKLPVTTDVHTPSRFEKHPDSEADHEREAAAEEEALQNPLSPSDAFYQNLSEDSELDMIKRLRDAKAPFSERLRSTLERWTSRVDNRGQSEALTLLRMHADTVSVSTTTQTMKTVVESVIPFMLKQPVSSLLLRHAASVATDIHAEALKPHLSFVLINVRETEMPASEGLYSDAPGTIGKPLACYACVSAQVIDDEFLCVTTKVHYGSKSGLCLLWRTTLYKAELRSGSD